MSYGAFVHACIEERHRATVGRVARIGSPEWEFQAFKYANDNFPDYTERDVLAILQQMKWPDRPVRVSEVLRSLRYAGYQPERAA